MSENANVVLRSLVAGRVVPVEERAALSRAARNQAALAAVRRRFNPTTGRLDS